MTRTEMLTAQFIEELSEIIKEVAKLQRFGPTEVMAGQPFTNAQRVCNEMNDMMALWYMMAQAGIVPGDFEDTAKQLTKMNRVEEYLKFSEQCGTLKD
jgi:hypothetical protein